MQSVSTKKKGGNYELLSVYFHSWLSLIFVQNIFNPVSHRANACINPRRIGSIAYPVETLQADQNGISIFFAAYRTASVTRTHSCGSVFISGTKTSCWNLTLIGNFECIWKSNIKKPKIKKFIDIKLNIRITG